MEFLKRIFKIFIPKRESPVPFLFNLFFPPVSLFILFLYSYKFADIHLLHKIFISWTHKYVLQANKCRHQVMSWFSCSHLPIKMFTSIKFTVETFKKNIKKLNNRGMSLSIYDYSLSLSLSFSLSIFIYISVCVYLCACVCVWLFQTLFCILMYQVPNFWWITNFITKDKKLPIQILISFLDFFFLTNYWTPHQNEEYPSKIQMIHLICMHNLKCIMNWFQSCFI